MNRKGTEKPIEIFVALFIILAVALVMLKLFQSQIAEKQKELSDVQQEQKSKEMIQKVRQACSDKCVDASNNGCSAAALASLCSFSSQNVLPGDFIDLNNNKMPDYDETLLAGIGVCEDRVYCFNSLISNCCNREISPQSCKQILKAYWGNKGLDVNATLTSVVTPGTCTVPTGHKRWDQLADWTSN